MGKKIKFSLTALVALASGFSVAQDVSTDFLKKEIEFAQYQYLNGSSESGFYALEALARLLESNKSSATQSDLGPNNLSFTYLRIGLLYEKAGDQSNAKAYFNKALHAYKGRKAEIVELKQLVSQLDQRSN